MSSRMIAFSLALAVISSGCSTMKRSDTARTGREQLLISNAVDQSLSKCDFTAFRGAKVFVEEKYLDCTDKGYIIGSVRHRLIINGAILAGKAEEADVVIEMRSGGVGTDNADSYVGIPEIVLPGMMTLPEVRFWQKNRQSALAKIGIVAYETKNHEMLGAGGVSAAMSNDTNMFMLGMGPYQYGSAKTEIERTTRRQMGQPYQEVPSLVAFRPANVSINPMAIPSPTAEDSGQVQLTGDQK